MKKTNYNDLFVNTYVRDGEPLVKGDGMHLVDAAGKKFLDFGSGIAVNALGHAHPSLVRELKAQGPKLLHVSNFYITASQIELAKLLLKHGFGESRVFLCNSGTEANEAAIKFARKKAKQESADKYHILSFHDGFHGRTYGGLSATAQARFHAGFEPIVPGFHYAAFNDIDDARRVLEEYSFAAIILEPLQAEGGVNLVDKDFLEFLRNYADEHRIALIFDEVQCGMGRTGTLWCHQHFGITPDIMTLAKPLGGGLPLGAVVCREWIAETIRPGDHGTTFGGNPLACALGNVVLSTIARKSFLRQVKSRGTYLVKKLKALQKRYAMIDEIRGMGLLIGVRMKSDPTPVVNECRMLGLLLIKAEHQTIRFLPPLIVSTKMIDSALDIFEKALKKYTSDLQQPW